MSTVAEAVLLASGSYNSAQTLDPAAISAASPLLSGFMGTPRAIEVVVDTTVFAAGSVTVSIQEFDIAAGTWANVLASAAIVATGRVRLTIGMGIPTVANASLGMIPPKRWRVLATSNGSAQTFSISGRVFTDS